MPLLVNLAICHPMTMQGGPISWQPLRADEVERLPSRLKSILGDTIEAGDEWVVLRVHGREIGGVVEYMNRLYTMWHVPRVRGREAQHLDRLLELLLGEDVLALSRADAGLAVDNLELRMAYLRDVPTLSAAQVHEASGRRSRNVSEPASRWKREGRVFAVRVGRGDRYPTFQFQDGSPRHAMKQILAALPEGLTDWQKALWFASGNGWLDGDEPQRRLNDAAAVVQAARRLAEPASG